MPRKDASKPGREKKLSVVESDTTPSALADVWDEDFDLDDEILAELDHTAEFFTPQEETKDEVFDDVDEIDEFFDEEDD